MLKRDHTGWLLAIVGLLLVATVLIYAVIESVELRAGQWNQEHDPKIAHLAESLYSIRDVTVNRVFRKSILPTSDILCELVVFSEALIYLSFPETDPIHSMSGDALKNELIRRIERSKETLGLPAKMVGLEMRDLEEQYKPRQEVMINLTLTGPGTKTLTGQRASFVVTWGAFKVPWQKRYVVEPPADELKSIAALEERKYFISIPAPEKPGEYSLYAVFDLYANETGDAWVTQSARSETKVLRVVE